MNMDRRTVLGAGTGLLLGAPLSAFSQPAAFADLYAKAKAEGEVTWYVAHYRTETCESIGRMFSQVYPGIKVNVVRATGQVIFQRLSQDIKVKAKNCDVFSASDQSHNITLRKMNMLMPYKPRTQAQCVKVVQEASDPDGYYTATDASMLLLIHSTKSVTPQDAPKKFSDLADPKWAGQVVVGHPGYSGSMGAWVVAMDKLYGWSFFERLAKNKPHIGRSLADPPTVINSGERRIGIGPAGMVAGMAAEGVPIKAVIPGEGAQLGFGPTALIANSAHPNAAKLFLEFMLSKEVGELLADIYAIPIRADVKPRPGSWTAGTVPGFRAPPAEVEKRLPELIEKWRDTFGV